MKTMKTLAGILALTMVCGTLAFAGMHGKGMGRGGHGPGLMRTLRQLDLTDSQKSQIQTIMESNKDQHQAARENVQAAMDDFREVMAADTFNETAIRQAFQKAASAREEAMVLRARTFHQIRQVLTAEQQAQLEQMRKQRQQKRGQRFGRGPGGGGPMNDDPFDL